MGRALIPLPEEVLHHGNIDVLVSAQGSSDVSARPVMEQPASKLGLLNYFATKALSANHSTEC